MTDDPRCYRAPGRWVDSAHPDVVAFARERVGDATDDAERAARLFIAVRDGLRYDPYSISRDPDAYRASSVVRRTRAFCIPKAVLLAAAARAVSIPARLRFADVRNHLSSPALRAAMGTDLFVYHGYVELHVGGRWIKASPAFDEGLCRFFGVAPLVFDGLHDAHVSGYDEEGEQAMEYVRDRGVFADLPYAEIRRAFVETYGDRPGP
ncbi:MAG: transglutaminase [Myxococcales bacterium]|nr:transglutaminase [Myxococcales bacterium]